MAFKTLVIGSLTASAMASTMSIKPISKPSFCLDLLGERTQNGTPIDIWECAAGLLGQQWFFDAGSYKIRSALNPKKCIDASGPELTLEDCSSNSTHQFFGWDIKSNAIFSTPDKGALKPSGSMCLQVTEAKRKGDAVSLQPCNATNALQQWTAATGPPPPPTKKNETFVFSPANETALCLDLDSESKLENGSPVKLTECILKSKSQEWIFTEGSYRIASALNPSKCVDAADMKKGTPLMIWDCNGFPQQQWGFQQAKGKTAGTVYLTQPPTDTSVCLATCCSSGCDCSAAVVGDCILKERRGLFNQWRLTRVMPSITIV